MARPRWKRLGVSAIKLAIAALVLWFVGRHVWAVWVDLGRRNQPIRIEPGWLILSGLFYLAGLTFCGVFFHQVMRAGPTPVARYPAIRAYLVSHLAKYVPFKTMVVVVRAGMVVPYGAKGVTAAVTTFYETLVMMASGGLVAAIAFGTTSTESDTLITLDAPAGWEAVGKFLSQVPLFGLLAAIGLALGLGFLMLVLPSVFGRLTRLVTTPFGAAAAETSPRFSTRLLIRGLLLTSFGWTLLGLSQVAVVRALAPVGPAGLARLAPMAIGSVAIATVAGFVVAVMPGGLGVREWVLMAALGPVIGEGGAVASAILLRLVWIAAELVAGGILVMIRPRPIREPVADPRIPAEMGQHLS